MSEVRGEVPCHIASSLLHPFLDGECGAPQSVVVSVHLRRCRECEQEARTVLVIRRVLRRPPAIDPDAVARLCSFVALLTRSPR